MPFPYRSAYAKINFVTFVAGGGGGGGGGVLISTRSRRTSNFVSLCFF